MKKIYRKFEASFNREAAVTDSCEKSDIRKALSILNFRRRHAMKVVKNKKQKINLAPQ